jgi:hypothetical protein
MGLFEVLAIIGALSWVYPLILWIEKKFRKTELRILSHQEIEIGYTTHGPIINLNLAFSAEKDDAFIERIIVELTHESSQKETFHWEWFEERLMEIELPESGGIMPYKRNQKAIALKAFTDSVIEKKIGFQSPVFKAKYLEQYQKTLEICQNLESTGNIENIRASKEYNDFEHLLKNSFSWKVGRYRGIVIAKVANRDKVFTKEIEFVLSNLDLRKLENNVNLTIATLENHFIGRNPSFIVSWNWVTPLDLKN